MWTPKRESQLSHAVGRPRGPGEASTYRFPVKPWVRGPRLGFLNEGWPPAGTLGTAVCAGPRPPAPGVTAEETLTRAFSHAAGSR